MISGSQRGAGICLKPQHYAEILSDRPEVGWFEVHSENYMTLGGPGFKKLEEIRAHYPISLHGVSLSMGSDEDLNRDHLIRLKTLVDRIDPAFVSEHLSWSRFGDVYLNDLLPFPYTEDTFQNFAAHVSETQDFLGHQIFVENPSAYMSFKKSVIPETEFLTRLVEKTDCKILLDVNNIYVSANNNGFDPTAYIDEIPMGSVGQIHLAGHFRKDYEDRTFCIDDHGSRVHDHVWPLFQQTIDRLGVTPTLIEWDTDVPDLSVLVDEANKAQAILDKRQAHAKAC